MNKIKSRLAMLLAFILLTGSIQGPVFAVQSGQRGRDAGVSAQMGTVDPDQVTQTEPLDLEPEEDTPEDPPEEEFYTVTVEMDGGYGGVYQGSVFDDAIGDYVTDASSFVKKVKKGEAVEFMPGSLYIGGEHQHDFLGWSLEPGGEIVGTTTSYTPTGDCTLYANWTSHIAFVFTDDEHKDHFPDGSLGKTVYADRDGWVTLPEDPISGTPGWRFYRWIWSDSSDDVEVVDGRVHIDYTRTLNPDWRDIKVESITLDKSTLDLEIGETAQLNVTSILPEDALTKEITWKSSDTKIATVDAKGNVKAVAKGTATITATTEDGTGISASCTVTVKQPVTGITLNKTALSLMKGKTSTLTAAAAPDSANNKELTWKSSNTKTATVDAKGIVKAVAKGTATITATAKDGSGVSVSCTVTVKQPVTKITLNKTALSLNKGKTFTLKATAGPASANNKAVKWTTSNKAVATVTSKGVVKGIKRGTATITATAKDGSGKKAVCKVTVKQLVTGLKINKTALTVKKGKTATLKVTVSPSNANKKTLKWTTSNKAVATVTSKGVVKGIKRGTATITATSTDGSKKKVTCKVTVK